MGGFLKRFLLVVLCAFVLADETVDQVSVKTSAIFTRNAQPHFVRTATRRIHMVYTDGEGIGTQVYYINSADNGRTWTQPRQLTLEFNLARDPLILVDSADKLSVVFEDKGSIYILDSRDEGKTWSRPFKVSGKFSEGRTPAAIGINGDIYLVWENAGHILYRMYAKESSTWSTIFDLSGIGAVTTATKPIVTGGQNHLFVGWLQNGEFVCRDLDLKTTAWGKMEQISDSNAKTGSVPAACDAPLLLSDKEGVVHAVWVNKSLVLHRVRLKGMWSPLVSRVSLKYRSGVGEPTAVWDKDGFVYVGVIENNEIIISQFNSKTLRWEKSSKLVPPKASVIFSLQLGGNQDINENLYSTASGYDLAFVERDLQVKDRAVIVFNSRTKLPQATLGPKIQSVASNGGFPYVTWTTPEDQTAVRFWVSTKPTVEGAPLYDSGKIDSSAQSYTLINFSLKQLNQYFFVKTQNRAGQWSEWSPAYYYKVVEDTDGPDLEILSIEEDSLYLYSPDPSVLYFGRGMEQPQTFTMRGRVSDTGSGVKKLVFSPAFGSAPPPLYDVNGEWSVRYTIQGSDDSGTIIVTAYDKEGKTTNKVIAVTKDSVLPEPPTWTKIYPNQSMIETSPKVGKSRTVFVTWTEGKDNGSGIRYHLMGPNQKWWQNQVHKSGDSEVGNEGDNTFYVYAVDNVGNVSQPGTDRIYLDSIPPAAPQMISQVTSDNYFYGKAADTEQILVNGKKDQDLEMLASGNWRFKHRMSDGQSQRYQFQAIDRVGNKSEALEVALRVDKTPPKLFYADHNAEDLTLRVKDRLVVTAKGDLGGSGFFQVGNLSGPVSMYDDGTRGDIKANDGIYTGIYYIDTEAKLGLTEIAVTLQDEVGNVATKKTMKPVNIDSTAPILLDDFDDPGDRYPWKNHAQAKNITAEDKVVEIQQGKGCLEVDYDFRNEQNWAGISSREFLPKNIFGSRAYLTFWLKGSGSTRARLFIYLQGKEKKDIVLTQKDIGINYSVSLANPNWQKVSIPIDSGYLDDLTEYTKYYVYVFSDNEQEQGTFYLDELKITYKIEGDYSPPVFTKHQPRSITTIAPGSAPAAVQEQAQVPGEFSHTPYLDVLLDPQPVLRGDKLQVKLTMPETVIAEAVYVNWGSVNGKIQKTKLTSQNKKVWRGTYVMPKDFVEGEHFGMVYVKTVNNRLYKKQFVFKVLDQANDSALERILPMFYPHPLLAGGDAKVTLKIPASVKTQSVMLFFGESQQKVFSVNLSRERTDKGLESWQGVFALPQMAPGEYAANIFIKTKDNRFIRKKAIYAVIAR